MTGVPKAFVGMETSGATRRELVALGCDVISCDVLPPDDVVPTLTIENLVYGTSIGSGSYHVVGDVFETLDALHRIGWRPRFGLFHPTCTFATYSAEWAYADPDFDRYPGVGYHQKIKPDTLVGPPRRQARVDALADMQRIVDLDIALIVMENPAGAFDRISPGYQSVQPYMFGDDASKKTQLHLVRMPPLEIPPKAHWVQPRIVNGLPRWSNQTDTGQNRVSPGEDRWKERSATYPGIAKALAIAAIDALSKLPPLAIPASPMIEEYA